MANRHSDEKMKERKRLRESERSQTQAEEQEHQLQQLDQSQSQSQGQGQGQVEEPGSMGTQITLGNRAIKQEMKVKVKVKAERAGDGLPGFQVELNQNSNSKNSNSNQSQNQSENENDNDSDDNNDYHDKELYNGLSFTMVASSCSESKIKKFVSEGQNHNARGRASAFRGSQSQSQGTGELEGFYQMIKNSAKLIHQTQNINSFDPSSYDKLHFCLDSTVKLSTKILAHRKIIQNIKNNADNSTFNDQTDFLQEVTMGFEKEIAFIANLQDHLNHSEEQQPEGEGEGEKEGEGQAEGEGEGEGENFPFVIRDQLMNGLKQNKFFFEALKKYPDSHNNNDIDSDENMIN